MFGNSIKNGLTITKVLGGLSKTLSIANQVIPLYKEAKPMISNAKNILSVLKDFNKGTNQNSNNNSSLSSSFNSSFTSSSNSSFTSNIIRKNKKETTLDGKRFSNNPSFFL